MVYDFRDTLSVYEGSQNAIRRNKEIGAFIELTLYQTIQNMGLDVRLAKLMEEIYAWTVDFSHLDPEDYFKVVYEEAYVDEASIGITRILAAQFHHHDKDYFAFYFPQDTLESYYDEEGQSVKRSFLKSPLRYTAANAQTENSPSLRTAYELEYVASKGTPVIALAKGDVSIISRNRQKGRYLKINHGEVYSTEYLHLGSVRDSLEVGMSVQQGEVVGYVGANQSGNQGSFSIQYFKNGRLTEASTFELGENADSISNSYQIGFDRTRNSLLKSLEEIEPKERTK